GNSVAVLNEGGTPRVMLAGHIDEIGLMVTHVDEEGFVYFDGIGGWDPQVLVGQRVRLLTESGEVVGVMGRESFHLITGDERVVGEEGGRGGGGDRAEADPPDQGGGEGEGGQAEGPVDRRGRVGACGGVGEGDPGRRSGCAGRAGGGAG